MSPILEGLPATHITDRLKKSEQIIRGLAAAIVGDHAGFRSVWEITNETFARWCGSPKRVTSQEGEVIQQVA